ncbi:ABC transporter substrate-binding protein [Halorientalis litorea]|uniref:ABC transporter substrate-binding protein n=1 Tax=Halorientalis litorea TaxID=2931977 RepID=UPI001FF5F214|nr:extracellular solute-binding protein [Halorientalis litorea]
MQESSEIGSGRRTRRTFIKTTGLGLGGAVALAGCSGDGGSDGGGSQGTGSASGDGGSGGSGPLQVALTSTNFLDMYVEHVLDPFTEETGIETEPIEISNPTQALPRFATAVQNGDAPADMILNTAISTIRGTNLDIWASYPSDRFSNLEYFDDSFVESVDGEVVGAPAQGWFLTLGHNDEMSNPPTAWADMWDSTYEDTLGVQNSIASNFLPDITAEVFFDGADTLQSEDGLDQVFGKMEELRPQVQLWFETGATFIQRLKQGDVPAGEYYHDTMFLESEGGADITSVFPEEGAVISYGHFSALKTSDRQEDAASLMEFSMRPEIQDGLAENLFTSPLIESQHSELSDEVYQNIAGPGPNAAISPNFSLYIGDSGEQIRERFQQFLVQ